MQSATQLVYPHNVPTYPHDNKDARYSIAKENFVNLINRLPTIQQLIDAVKEEKIYLEEEIDETETEIQLIHDYIASQWHEKAVLLEQQALENADKSDPNWGKLANACFDSLYFRSLIKLPGVSIENTPTSGEYGTLEGAQHLHNLLNARTHFLIASFHLAIYYQTLDTVFLDSVFEHANKALSVFDNDEMVDFSIFAVENYLFAEIHNAILLSLFIRADNTEDKAYKQTLFEEINFYVDQYYDVTLRDPQILDDLTFNIIFKSLESHFALGAYAEIKKYFNFILKKALSEKYSIHVSEYLIQAYINLKDKLVKEEDLQDCKEQSKQVNMLINKFPELQKYKTQLADLSEEKSEGKTNHKENISQNFTLNLFKRKLDQTDCENFQASPEEKEARKSVANTNL